MTVKSLASTAMQCCPHWAGIRLDIPVRRRQQLCCRSFPEKQPSRDTDTATPIKHVIVIVGENRSFDHVFATYVPQKGEKVWNLLSEGIVKADGTPGANFSKAEQLAANDTKADGYLLDPLPIHLPVPFCLRLWPEGRQTPMSRMTTSP